MKTKGTDSMGVCYAKNKRCNVVIPIIALFAGAVTSCACPYPPKFFVFQSQDTGTLRKQLHLHSRKGVCRGKVTLSSPAVKTSTRKTLEKKIEAAAATACHLSTVALEGKRLTQMSPTVIYSFFF